VPQGDWYVTAARQGMTTDGLFVRYETLDSDSRRIKYS
jgi:hypothetical protein